MCPRFYVAIKKRSMKKEKTNNNIHIGSIIKAIVKQQRISDMEFASMIHCHPTTLVDIYKRHDINSGLLWKISVALGYNFYTDIYGAELSRLLKNKPDDGITNIVVSAEKISITYHKGTARVVEYRKFSEKES